MSWDPYLDLEHGVLRNLLQLCDRGTLAEAEAELTSYRLVELQTAPLPGAYDLPHLQAFHRHIFGDVYDWAGELRTVSIGKGHLFCLPQHLVSFGADVFGRLARDQYLRGLSRADFVTALTTLAADINALHPFREGNGRIQRAFLAQLARDAGHRLRWSRLDPEQNIAASRAAHAGDNTALWTMLDRLVDAELPEHQPRSRPPMQRAPQD